MNNKGKSPRRVARVNQRTLRADLNRYLELAKQLGASDAKTIKARDVKVDERVTMKCLVPRCYSCGESPNCPPYTPKADEMRAIISKYTYAILFKLDIEPVGDFADKDLWPRGHISHYRKIFEIVGKLESQMFNDAHYLAMGFAAGTCKAALCDGLPCQFFDSGRCRFPLKARPSMEAVGIDAFNLLSKVGWNVYPIGHKETPPRLVPCAVAAGIVFVE